MITITKIDFPILFVVGSLVTFHMSDGTIYDGEIKSHGEYFIDIDHHCNDIVFSSLGIEFPSLFVKKIVGYEVQGAWPYVKTLDGLRKVLEALRTYNRIPEDKKVIINDDEKKPFTLSIKGRKNVVMNFKI